MEKNDADILLDTYSLCWMKNNPKIEYLAVIKNDKKKNSYSIEMGIKSEDNSIRTENVSYKDIPMECKLSKISNKRLNISNSLYNKIVKSETINIKSKYVNKIKLQGVSEHKIRPMLSGCSIQTDTYPDILGTLGAFVVIEPYDDKVYALTNHHVLTKKAFYKKDLVFQPDNKTNDFSNIIGEIKFSHFGKTEKGTFLDVAFIELLNNRNTKNMFTKGFIWSDGLPETDSPSLNGIENPSIHNKVKIYGKSSKLNTSKVISDNAYVRIENNSVEEIFQNQILIENISKDGDSGSVVINDNNNVIGLLFAGDGKHISVANNINHIFNNKYTIDGFKRSIKFLKFLT